MIHGPTLGLSRIGGWEFLMASPRRSDEWYQHDEKWTLSLGQRGMRVRLFQKRRDGVFFRAVWIPGSGCDQASLQTNNRDEAERLGRELLAALQEANGPLSMGTVRLGELARRYQAECTTHLDNTPRTIKYEATLIDRMVRFFGPNFDVQRLTDLEWRRFELARRSGATKGENGKPDKCVSDRSVHGDFVLLRTMLSWACRVRLPSGQRWLDRDPLDGVTVRQEKNPKRPIASWNRFVRTRTALQQFAANATDISTAHRWIKVEFALVLAEATGRRIGSIRALCWEDFDLDAQLVTWRAEYDKRGVEWVTPIPDRLCDEVAKFRKALGGLSGPIFTGERKATRLMNRRVLDRWLTEAEAHAGLQPLRGGSWHPYRRKWATERKHLPLVDVAAAGGWKGTQMLLKCYQQPDPDTILSVMNEPSKLGDQWEAATGRGRGLRAPTRPRALKA
jgi:integrase